MRRTRQTRHQEEYGRGSLSSLSFTSQSQVGLCSACDSFGKIFATSFSRQVNLAWENLNKSWRERVERLEEAMQAAVQFQDGLQVFEDNVT